MMTEQSTIQPAPTAPQPQAVKRHLANWVLFLAGVVLIIAGMLKGYDLLRGEVTKNYFFHSAEVLLELVAGIWFTSSIAAYYALRVGALLFTIFLAVSLHRAWQGQINCGCFGPVPMNPWITAAMDGIFLLLLLAVIPKQAKTALAEGWRKALAALLALGILCSIIAGGFYLQPGMLHADGTLTGGHGVVFMQPPAWDKKRFPMASYVHDSKVIMRGKWLAVIYFHTCPVCQHAIAG
ncbi:MAG: MauE/DoxX family redox-associated membrane protein, partial [Phycisphaerae bacterium]